MPSLLDLPAPLIRRIFTFVGHEHFSSAANLSICKSYCAHATAVRYSSLNFTATTLSNFLFFPSSRRSQRALISHCHKLSIHLTGFSSWDTVSLQQWREVSAETRLLKEYDDALAASFYALLPLLKECQSLESFSLTALPEAPFPAEPSRPMRTYLRSRQISDVLWALPKTVQKLVLDIPGVGGAYPLCPNIARWMPRCRVLHVRVGVLCADLLRFPWPVPEAKIEDLVVSLIPGEKVESGCAQVVWPQQKSHVPCAKSCSTMKPCGTEVAKEVEKLACARGGKMRRARVLRSKGMPEEAGGAVEVSEYGGCGPWRAAVRLEDAWAFSTGDLDEESAERWREKTTPLPLEEEDEEGAQGMLGDVWGGYLDTFGLEIYYCGWQRGFFN